MSKNNHIIKDGARKHAALIHAWADGAEIQAKNKDGWVDICGTPAWFPDTEYRLKPKTRTVKFRNYHVDGVMGVWMQGYQGLPGNATLIDKHWQEVEIEL